MNTITIPPSGVPAVFIAEVPAPPGMETVGGLRLFVSSDYLLPEGFTPRLEVADAELPLELFSAESASAIWLAPLPEALPNLAHITVSLNDEGVLEAGSTLTVYAWGAQTVSGEGAFDPDSGEQTWLTDTVEVGFATVVTWDRWNEISEGEGS